MGTTCQILWEKKEEKNGDEKMLRCKKKKANIYLTFIRLFKVRDNASLPSLSFDTK